MRNTAALVITYGSPGNFITRDFHFDSCPSETVLREKLVEFFAAFGMNPTTIKASPQPCALLSPRKPNDSKAHSAD